MRAIIIEDEHHSQVQLKSLITKYCSDVSILGVAETVNLGQELFYEKRPDTIFLDIELGGESGFKILESIKDYSFSVIFTSAHEKYSLRAIKFAALDYLLKPIQINELVLAVEKAKNNHIKFNQSKQLDLLLENLKSDTNYYQTIAVPQSREIRLLKLSEILYLESSNNYTTIHTTESEKLIVSKGIYYFDELLSTSGFIRTHQTYLVNKHFIKGIVSTNELVLFNNVRIPISKQKLSFVKETVMKQCL